MNVRRCLLVALLTASAPSAMAAELGRLFLSPEHRAALDQARRAENVVEVPLVVPPVEELAAPETAPPAPPRDAVRLDGYVERSSGQSTFWFNGRDSYQDNFADLGVVADEVRIEDAGVRVPLDGDQAVLLKPGQSFDPGSERISDGYQRRRTAPGFELEDDAQR